MSLSDMPGDVATPPGRTPRGFLRSIRSRSKRTVIAAVGTVVLAMGLTLPLAVAASAGTIGTASGFEDDDGNLAVDSTFDWNGFSPVTWTGTAPNQTATKTASGWAFSGFTDAQATNSDSGYAGGVKQDVNCATIKGSKAPNKDDLKRIYLSSKTVNGHVYLNLAWMRIPQNSVNASTHVGFEFNQSKTACGGSSDGLVQRTAGDLLFVYDFEGSSAGIATLTVRKWVTSGTCEISQDSAPCWGPATDLTASGFAEAKVNETSVTDTVAPGGDSLGVAEFGEAGVDLTAAGIFGPNVCTGFGQAEGVSRSSGNSGTAAMEDLVGPGPFTISNCGSLGITKVSSKNNAPVQGATFSIKDSNGNEVPGGPFTSDANGKVCVNNLQAGSYTVTESAAPAGYAKDTSTKTATVTTSSTCDNTNVTFTDTPLTNVTVTSSSRVSGPGGTSSTITCTPTGSTTNIGNSPQTGQSATVTANDLLPGSYTCTLVIDP